MKAGRGNNRGDSAGTWARNNYREGETGTKKGRGGEGQVKNGLIS